MSEGLWALAGVLVGVLASGIINLLLQRRQQVHEVEMYTLKNQSTENVKSLLKEMMSHKSYTDRTFDAEECVGSHGLTFSGEATCLSVIIGRTASQSQSW